MSNSIEPLRFWLRVLSILLIAWQPLNVALAASSVLNALAIRGWALGVLMAMRIFVAALGVAAGMAILGRRPAAIALAKTSLLASAATDLIVYWTPYFPDNRMPGDAPYFLAASLVYYTAWLLYLFRVEPVVDSRQAPKP